MKGWKNRGFTLIEMLAVISVICILSAILMPIVGNAIAGAKKVRASRNLQQIVAAYLMASMNGVVSGLYEAKTANEWGAKLAQVTELNAAGLFAFSDDYLLEHKHVPKTIMLNKRGKKENNPEFLKLPLSVVIIAGVTSNAPAETTPIAYTRGLDPVGGMWKEAIGSDGGVYGTEGGYIVFLDGHVEFFHDLNQDGGQLTHFYTGEKTGAIAEAVNEGARALSFTGVEWEAAPFMR